ncbi:hypothetical protein DIPPA_02070 [Diplonema papillatum]|nr:hypothetical protein DIPPA_02070 [Diplonema papillatum]
MLAASLRRWHLSPPQSLAECSAAVSVLCRALLDADGGRAARSPPAVAGGRCRSAPPPVTRARTEPDLAFRAVSPPPGPTPAPAPSTPFARAAHLHSAHVNNVETDAHLWADGCPNYGEAATTGRSGLVPSAGAASLAAGGGPSGGRCRSQDSAARTGQAFPVLRLGSPSSVPPPPGNPPISGPRGASRAVSPPPGNPAGPLRGPDVGLLLPASAASPVYHTSSGCPPEARAAPQGETHAGESIPGGTSPQFATARSMSPSGRTAAPRYVGSYADGASPQARRTVSPAQIQPFPANSDAGQILADSPPHTTAHWTMPPSAYVGSYADGASPQARRTVSPAAESARIQPFPVNSDACEAGQIPAGGSSHTTAHWTVPPSAYVGSYADGASPQARRTVSPARMQPFPAGPGAGLLLLRRPLFPGGRPRRHPAASSYDAYEDGPPLLTDRYTSPPFPGTLRELVSLPLRLCASAAVVPGKAGPAPRSSTPQPPKQLHFRVLSSPADSRARSHTAFAVQTGGGVGHVGPHQNALTPVSSHAPSGLQAVHAGAGGHAADQPLGLEQRADYPHAARGQNSGDTHAPSHSAWGRKAVQTGGGVGHVGPHESAHSPGSTHAPSGLQTVHAGAGVGHGFDQRASPPESVPAASDAARGQNLGGAHAPFHSARGRKAVQTGAGVGHAAEQPLGVDQRAYAVLTGTGVGHAPERTHHAVLHTGDAAAQSGSRVAVSLEQRLGGDRSAASLSPGRTAIVGADGAALAEDTGVGHAPERPHRALLHTGDGDAAAQSDGRVEASLEMRLGGDRSAATLSPGCSGVVGEDGAALAEPGYRVGMFAPEASPGRHAVTPHCRQQPSATPASTAAAVSPILSRVTRSPSFGSQLSSPPRPQSSSALPACHATHASTLPPSHPRGPRSLTAAARSPPRSPPAGFAETSPIYASASADRWSVSVSDVSQGTDPQGLAFAAAGGSGAAAEKPALDPPPPAAEPPGHPHLVATPSSALHPRRPVGRSVLFAPRPAGTVWSPARNAPPQLPAHRFAPASGGGTLPGGGSALDFDVSIEAGREPCFPFRGRPPKVDDDTPPVHATSLQQRVAEALNKYQSSRTRAPREYWALRSLG